ncbi:hypothetical protein J2Z69_000430 [Paenibacillus shirakamiensis]|uniref:Uncharacterized protein n=1 Tax=Paenibacillus shirakamiensis TaxID=1265935 RepID=A0ABS4JE67_9BACL|nr:hypothetical protein [Paenibacillus shirakamiensis]
MDKYKVYRQLQRAGDNAASRSGGILEYGPGGTSFEQIVSNGYNR